MWCEAGGWETWEGRGRTDRRCGCLVAAGRKERRYWLGARQNGGPGLLSRWGVHLKDCPKESVRQGERPTIGEGCHNGRPWRWWPRARWGRRGGLRWQVQALTGGGPRLEFWLSHKGLTCDILVRGQVPDHRCIGHWEDKSDGWVLETPGSLASLAPPPATNSPSLLLEVESRWCWLLFKESWCEKMENVMTGMKTTDLMSGSILLASVCSCWLLWAGSLQNIKSCSSHVYFRSFPISDN